MLKSKRNLECTHCKKILTVPWHAEEIRCDGCGGSFTAAMIDKEGSKRRHRLSFWRIFWPETARPAKNGSPGDPISKWEATSRKRALLCGVTYSKQKYKLQGSMNDVNSMRDLLVERFQFPVGFIRILAETESHHHPTKKNIQEALRWLVKDCRSGDSLVFYFSGHGLRQPDFYGDEVDGFDETICPLDFQTTGMILDNEINETIVRPLPSGVTLHAVVDACHSGTILDLPHVYSTRDQKWTDNSPPSGVYKGTSGGIAISLGACQDHQLAADTSAFSDSRKKMEGAMTHTFKKAVEENPNVTYAGLLASMRKSFVKEKEQKCLGIRDLYRRQILQEPVLSSSEKFNINKEFKL